MTAQGWEPVAWDTDFFGHRTARLLLSRPEEFPTALEACRDWGAEVVHCLLPVDDDALRRLLEADDFHLVDVRLTFEWTASRGVPAAPSDEVATRLHQPGDVEALEKIARRAYEDTRYYRDGRYARAKCDAMYATWLRQSCEGSAEAVWVADQDGAPAGYVTCHLRGEAGQVGLVGIREDARGRGVGRALLRAGQRWFAERGAGPVRVVTQGRNLAAQKLYQSCGFRSHSVELWYHRWL